MSRFDSTEFDGLSLLQALQLPPAFEKTVTEIYLPLAEIITAQVNTSPLLVSINGAQGAGKTTLTTFLKKIIESCYGLRVASFSIDDFYLSKKHRLQLASSIHPLLKTRGVPGTHETALLEATLDDLFNARCCEIPRFDKACDERCEREKWTAIKQPVDIILFEGWCVNSPVQMPEELLLPVNRLEEKEDSEAIWRHYVNEQLQQYHNRIFTHSALTIMLNIIDFSRVYDWRLLQESKLPVASSTKAVKMSKDTLQRFIQHFERITRHSLLKLPAQVDIELPLNENHTIRAILQK